MSDVWGYIRRLLGPGLHWGRSEVELQAAIERAKTDNRQDAVEHLEIIKGQRGLVAFDKEKI